MPEPKEKMTQREKEKARRAASRRLAREKEEAIQVMILKYKLKREDVLETWDQFYEQNPDGFMSKENFLENKEVMNFFHLLTKSVASQTRRSNGCDISRCEIGSNLCWPSYRLACEKNYVHKNAKKRN